MQVYNNFFNAISDECLDPIDCKNALFPSSSLHSRERIRGVLVWSLAGDNILENFCWCTARHEIEPAAYVQVSREFEKAKIEIHKYRRHMPGLLPIKAFKNIDLEEEQYWIEKELEWLALQTCSNTDDKAHKKFLSEIEELVNNISFQFVDLKKPKRILSEKIYSMGLDTLFNKVRKFFSHGPSSNSQLQSNNNSCCDENEFVRKRTSDAYDTDHQFKYRRVQNTFPKIAKSSLDNDGEFLDINHSESFSSMDSNMLINRQSLRPGVDNIDIAGAKSKERKSIFDIPATSRRLIKTSVPTEIDLVENDNVFIDDCNIINSELNKKKLNSVATFWKKPVSNGPPPLVDTRTGEYITVSQLPRKSLYPQPLLSHEVLQQNVEYERSSLSSSSNCGSVLTGGRGSQNLWKTSEPQSILSHINENEDHDHYLRLLREVMPRIYGNEHVHSSTNGYRDFDTQVGNNQLPPSTRPISSTDIINEKYDKQKQCFANQNFNSIINGGESGQVLNNNVQQPHVSNNLLKQGFPLPKRLTRNDENEISKNISHQNYNDAKADHHTMSIVPENSSMEKLQIKIPFNSIALKHSGTKVLLNSWLGDLEERWGRKREDLMREKEIAEKRIEETVKERRIIEREMCYHIKSMTLFDRPLIQGYFDFENDQETGDDLKPITQHQISCIKEHLSKSPTEVLISKFGLNITRNDIATLVGSNWLNDEVINFYMNLLTDRSEKVSNLPKVYAMNTFFAPRLLQNGYSGVKRWTRKIDLFDKDIIPVPVHVGGVHWCMAIIHLRNKSIKYYDSMGRPNPAILRALEQYLHAESLDKRKIPFDTSSFQIESVGNVPHQTNGSDCGVFSCMFAEYITRDKPIDFSQDNMEYFRQKMILEIVDGALWN